MLDNSIVELLQASRDVPIYLRSASNGTVMDIPMGHMDCLTVGCNGPAMSRLRYYGLMAVEAQRRDGCVSYLNFVYSPEDRFYAVHTEGSLARIMRLGGGHRKNVRGEDLTPDRADMWVRLYAEPGEPDNHINGRLNLYDALGIGEDDDEDDDDEHNSIMDFTFSLLPYVRGGYISPGAASFPDVEHAREVGRLQRLMPAVRGEKAGFMSMYGQKVFNVGSGEFVQLTPKMKDLVMS